jgi:uncharacterized protein (TIGR02444 family)
MGEVATEERPENGLWQFSLAFYEVPGVARALIALQDRDGFDVNLILFALWLGLSGYGPRDCTALAAADRAVRAIRTEVVEPLRALRRKLRHDPDVDVQRLRDGVKALELAAEQLVQSRLARLAGHHQGKRSRDSRLADAYANLALYLGPKSTGKTEAAVIRNALDAFLPRR